MMASLFVRDMKRLTTAVLKLAALVEEMIQASVRSLCDHDPVLARRVIRRDRIIDRMEVRIAEDCLRVLALHDPVASDLRRVIAVLKINNELERIADLAVSIAQRLLALDEDPQVVPIPEDMEVMTALVVEMVRGSLDALVETDAGRGRAVIALDDEVDHQHRQLIDKIKTMIRVRPDRLDAGLHLFSAAGHLERIADHATNIAEEVVYLKEGAIIRHHHGELVGTRSFARSARESAV
ncbi:MAG: phosphate signaling complex protein PhoU [Isosphaeraceae bacterium]